MLELFIVGLIGIMFHVGFQLDKATLKEDYDWEIFIRQNVFNWFVSIAIVCLVLFAKEEVEKYFEITKLSIPFIGYFGAEIFNKFKGIFKNRFKK